MASLVTCQGDAAGGSLATLLLKVWRQWQITILVLVSASLQLLLVLAGVFRKRVLSRTFHGLLWLSFLGMEAASIYALGLMLASGCDHVFSLWAPLILFHMGAADAINAYAPADNELWRRSAFKLGLSLIATACILNRTHLCQRYMPAAILLAIVGSFKYIERVYALRQGSSHQTLVSARPIYNFMARAKRPNGAHCDDPDLLVAGEWQWYKEERKARSNREDMSTMSNGARNDMMVVHYKDVINSAELMEIDEGLKDLCLAYALFKIYRRRLSNLRIHSKEEDYQNVRKLILRILKIDRKKLITVIDLEMSFIFDSVFTKAAAGSLFQGIGLATRLLSALFLVIAFLVLALIEALEVGCGVSTNELNLQLAGAHGPLRELTCFIIVLAIMVECFQIYRHVRCDSFRVWLAYTYITEKRCIPTSEDHDMEKSITAENNAYIEKPPHTGGHHKAAKSSTTSKEVPLSRFMIMMHTLQMKAILALLGCGRRSRKSTKWYYNVGQHSVLEDTLDLVFRHYFITFQIDGMQGAYRKKKDIMQRFKLDAEQLQESLIKRLVSRCDELSKQSREQVRKKAQSMSQPFQDGNEKTFTGIEEVVLHCHIVTSMCEISQVSTQSAPTDQEQNPVHAPNEHMNLSIWLSRYCLYLMLKRSKLIPEDPDMAAILYARVKEDLCNYLLNSTANFLSSSHEDSIDIETPLLNKVKTAEHKGTSGDLLQLALHHTYKLLQAEDHWNTLAQVWLDIVICIATAENATPHTEQMAKGGELLTLLWVILGHLGISQNV